MQQKTLLSQKVGENLKKQIKASKFKTQENFAVKGMSVDPVTVRRWIAHGVKDIDTIKEIADVLEISFMELLQ